MTLDDAVAASPIIAILRGVTPADAVAHTEALFEAGVRAVEIPLNSPEPLESLRRVVGAVGGEMICGAGTVLSLQDVAAVADAGGGITVSPNTDVAVIARSLALGLTPIPGFATASEAFAAIAAGARWLKLFPAATHGAAHLRALKAVLPSQIRVIAVGGVGAADMAAWLAAGADGFGIGGEVYQPGQSPSETREKARRAVAAAR